MLRIQIVLAFVIFLTFVGCSSEKSPVTPDPTPQHPSHLSENISNRSVLGYWTINIDPDSEAVEIIPDRDMASHFNVVRLLEITPCTDCLKIKNLSFLPDNNLQCDFELRHPFPGLDKFTGFDVRGVLVTNGDTNFPENNRLASLDGSNPILLNPDGYTALFNPVEFPEDSAPFPILEYIPGKFSSGDNFTATLNPFMAFGKENPRRMFGAGTTESVTVNLKYPSAPFEFGYIVDASWTKVDEVLDPLTDFPPDANCLEPYKLDLRLTSQLINDPGSTADIQVTVYDHQGIDTISTVSIECPSLFNGEVFLNYSSQSTDDSWLFEGEITNEFDAPAHTYKVLVKAASLESDPNLGELGSYQIGQISVVYANLIWAKRAGGTDKDRGYAITTLSDNSSEVTGNFWGTATFGEGEPNETVLVSDGNWDIFVARYNPDGTLAWAKRAGGTGTDSGFETTTLSDNSTVVTGRCSNFATFGEGEANETILVPYGYGDIFVARYNPDGTLAWAKSAGGETLNSGRGITTLSDDSTVVTGSFYESATFGEGEPNETVLVSTGVREIFIARYNPDGTLAWAIRAGGMHDDCGYGITTLSDDSTVVTGVFEDNAIFGEGEPNETVLVSEDDEDIFVARYKPDGTLAWAKRAGGETFDRGQGITALSDDSTVVTGVFEDNAIFGEGDPNQTVLVSADERDIFVARYNPDGTLAWVKRAGGRFSDFGYGVTTLSDDSTVVTGRFQNTAIFGTGDPNETVLESAGEWDIFVARYNPDGTLAWAIRAGGMHDDCGYGITTLSDDSTVVTGYFYEAATFGAGELNETVLESAGGKDIFIARFAP